jgi:hypothetical protein
VKFNMEASCQSSSQLPRLRVIGRSMAQLEHGRPYAPRAGH